MKTQAIKNVSRPGYRVSEEGQSVTLLVALPGVLKEAIQVSSEGQVLQIKADREQSIPEEWNLISNYAAPESYELEVNISNKYDLAQAKAEFSNNMLELTILERDSNRLELEIN